MEDLIAEPAWFVLLIFLCEAIITTWLIITYWFGKCLKVSINH